MKYKNCSDCGKAFICCHTEDNKSCWCNDYPPIMPLDFSKDCRCVNCLKKVVKEKIETFVSTITPQTALNCLPKSYTQHNSQVEGIDYVIENGYTVFSKWFHLKRGYCCKHNCRNCPY